MKARFAVDFDGTLIEDDKYPAMGDWIPGAADAVRALERLGTVVIFSCRAAPASAEDERPRSQAEVDRDIAMIKSKLQEEGLGHLEVWVKPYKPPAAAYIDNKGVAFRGDWEETLEDVLDLIAPITVGDRERERFAEAQEALAAGDVEALTDLLVADTVAWKDVRHPNSQRFHDRLQTWGDLHDRKQRDYGSDTDPFANIRQGAADIGLPGWVGCAIRMRDKMQRILTAAKQYIETGEVSMANEALVDSFDDLGVYSGIGAVLLEEES